MKILFTGIFITFISLNGFATTDLSCFDPSAALIAPCEEGLNLFFDKGSCTGPDIAHAYCAEREMTNLTIIEDETTKTFAPYGGMERVLLSETGMMIVAREGMAKNCQDASLLIGQDKESVDQAAQTGFEIGISHELIRFHCNDQ